MDMKKVLKSKPLLLVLLAGIVLLAIYFSTVLIKAEKVGDVMGNTIQYKANNQADNSSYSIWYKTVKTSNGIALLKSDSYNILSISISGSSWMDNRWSIQIEIAGIGATRSGYGLLKANGLKTITLDTNQGSSIIHAGSTTNLHGRTKYLSEMLSVATDKMDDEVNWQTFTPDTVSLSTDHLAGYNGNTRRDSEKGRYSATIQKWQYSDLSAGDSSDAIYALDTYVDCYPDRVEDLYYISTFSWGLFDSSTNVIHLRVHLPPDPTKMTEEEQKRYGIYHYSHNYGGAESSGYGIKNIQHEVYED